MTNLDLHLWIDNPAGTALDLEDGVTYSLEATAMNERATTWRKRSISSEWVAGTFDVFAVRENVTEQVKTWVHAATPYGLYQAVKALTDCYSQLSYKMYMQWGDVTETWTCMPANYSVSSSGPLMSATRALVSAEVPRLPGVIAAPYVPPPPPPPPQPIIHGRVGLQIVDLLPSISQGSPVRETVLVTPTVSVMVDLIEIVPWGNCRWGICTEVPAVGAVTSWVSYADNTAGNGSGIQVLTLSSPVQLTAGVPVWMCAEPGTGFTAVPVLIDTVVPELNSTVSGTYEDGATSAWGRQKIIGCLGSSNDF